MLSQHLNHPSVVNQESASPRATANLNPAELIRNPYISVAITMFLLAATTWLVQVIQVLAHAPRPYTIFYLIPVAIASALLGLRGGYTTVVLSILLAYAFLFRPTGAMTSTEILHDAIEMVAMAIGTLAIATVVGRLRNALMELHRLNRDLVLSEERRVTFNREVLLAVTGGRLMLCEASDIRKMLEAIPDFSMQLAQPADASALRHHLHTVSESPGMDKIRWADLETGVTEAATNAIKHGNGGYANIWATPAEVTVLVADTGKGISPSELARATLERGYSTRYSLGMGFTMMLEAADSVALSTSSSGTMILLRVGSGSRTSPEANLLARYDAG